MQHFAKHPTLFLVITSLLISGCNGLGEKEALRPEERTQIEEYIRANIGTLSTVPPVLGGSFGVTDIAWKEDDTAVVRYEDGHIALTAEAKAGIGDGNVVMESFAVEEPSETAFANDTFGFFFTVPKPYTAVKNSDTSMTVGRAQNGVTEGLVEVEVYKSDDYDGEVTDDSFVVSRLKATCAADGAGASVRCTAVASTGTLTTQGDYEAMQYTLTEETGTGGTVTGTRARGPFSVLSVERPEGTSASGQTILVIRPSTAAASVDTPLMEQILRSLRFSKSGNGSLQEEAQLGEFCGGIAGILCASGLTCRYEGTYPDAGGTCFADTGSAASQGASVAP